MLNKEVEKTFTHLVTLKCLIEGTVLIRIDTAHKVGKMITFSLKTPIWIQNGKFLI